MIEDVGKENLKNSGYFDLHRDRSLIFWAGSSLEWCWTLRKWRVEDLVNDYNFAIHCFRYADIRILSHMNPNQISFMKGAARGQLPMKCHRFLNGKLFEFSKDFLAKFHSPVINFETAGAKNLFSKFLRNYFNLLGFFLKKFLRFLTTAVHDFCEKFPRLLKKFDLAPLF